MSPSHKTSRLVWADPFELSIDDLAQETAEQIAREKREAEHTALVAAIRPLVGRAFPGGWWHGNPLFVGKFDDDDLFDYETDTYKPGRFSFPCRGCRRDLNPLLARSCIALGGGWRWRGISHQEPETDYFVACGWCGTPMLFTICTPQ